MTESSKMFIRAGSSKSRTIRLLTKKYADTGLHILNEFERAEREIFENNAGLLVNIP